MKRVIYLSLLLFIGVVNAQVISGHEQTQKSSVEEYDMSNVINLIGYRKHLENYWVLAHREKAKYPKVKHKDRVSGCVELAFVISPNGKAENIHIIKSAPNDIFNVSAVKAIKKFKWKSSESNHDARSVLTTYQIDYTIQFGTFARSAGGVIRPEICEIKQN